MKKWYYLNIIFTGVFVILVLTSGVNLLTEKVKCIHATEKGFLGGNIVFDKFFEVVSDDDGNMLYYQELSCPPELLFNCIKECCVFPMDMCPCYTNFN